MIQCLKVYLRKARDDVANENSTQSPAPSQQLRLPFFNERSLSLLSLPSHYLTALIHTTAPLRLLYSFQRSVLWVSKPEVIMSYFLSGVHVYRVWVWICVVHFWSLIWCKMFSVSVMWGLCTSSARSIPHLITSTPFFWKHFNVNHTITCMHNRKNKYY